MFTFATPNATLRNIFIKRSHFESLELLHYRGRDQLKTTITLIRDIVQQIISFWPQLCLFRFLHNKIERFTSSYQLSCIYSHFGRHEIPAVSERIFFINIFFRFLLKNLWSVGEKLCNFLEISQFNLRLALETLLHFLNCLWAFSIFTWSLNLLSILPRYLNFL